VILISLGENTVAATRSGLAVQDRIALTAESKDIHHGSNANRNLVLKPHWFGNIVTLPVIYP
jgi:hypothetical protein